MIFTERTVRVSNDKSTINAPVILYRGDKNIEIRFELLESPYKYSNRGTVNIIETTDASYGQLVIKAPNDEPAIFSDIVETQQSHIIFTITYDMIDEVKELGTYDFQIRLFDANQTSKVSLPEIIGGIIIKEPIAIEDMNNNNANSATVGNAIVTDEYDVPVFNDNGYIKTDWHNGDVISKQKLNKMEEGIYETYNLAADNSVEIKKKPDASTVDAIQKQVNGLVLGATGDGNNAEVVQARGKYGLLSDRLNDSDFYNGVAQESSVKSEGELYGVITNVKMCNKQYDTNNNTWKDIENRCVSLHGYKLYKGDTIGISDYVNYSVSYFKFDSLGNFVTSINWYSEDIKISDSGYIYYVYVKKNNNETITNTDLQIISKLVNITKANYVGKHATDCYNAFEENGNVYDGLTMFKHLKDNYNDNILNQQLLVDNKIQNIPIIWGTKDNGKRIYNLKNRCITINTIRSHPYDKICLTDYDTFSWTMFAYDLNGENPQSCGWQTKDLDIRSSSWANCLIEFVFKKNDESEFTVDDIEYLSKCFYIEKSSYSNNHTHRLNNLMNIKNIILDNITDLKNVVNGEIINLPLEYKVFDDNNSTWTPSDMRVATVNPVTINVGDVIQLLDTENYMYVYYAFDNNGNKINGSSWSTNSIIVGNDSALLGRQIYFMFKRVDNQPIEPWELENIANNFVIISNRNSLAKLQNIDLEVNKLKLGLIDYDIVINNSNIVEIAQGSFYQKTFSPLINGNINMPYHMLVKTNDTTGDFGNVICLRQKIGNDNSGNRVNATYVGEGYYFVEGFTYNNETTSDIEVFFDFRTITTNITIDWYQIMQDGVGILTKFDDINSEINKIKLGIGSLNAVEYKSDVGEIAQGSYYQKQYYAFSTTDMNYHMLVKTNDITGNFGNVICLRQQKGDDHNANRVNAKYIGDGYYFVEGFIYDEAALNNIEVFFDFRYTTSGITIEWYKILQEGVNVSTENSGEVVLYVSPSGNDSNDGSDPSKPLATIQQAINMGATTVLCKRGIYNIKDGISSDAGEGKSLKILPYENNSYSSSVTDRPLIVLNGGTTLSSLATDDGLLTQAFKPNKHIKQVFVDKTKDPIDTSNTRSVGYYSTVWQLHEDETLDVKLKPVLTLAECKAEAGTFFHDGTNIYINPFTTTYTSFVVPISTNILSLNNYSELVLEDIEVEFSYSNNFILHNNMNTTVRNCHSKYTMLSDGFSLDNTNGNFYNCTAFKSRNDGFNIHLYGETNFYNCSGYYNYDDGISHHDGCVGVVDGGEWHHNGKGGISSPTHGAYIDIYNVECYNNGYGVYASSASDRRQCVGRVFNSVLYNNINADIIVQRAKIKVYNTKYTKKSISSNSDTEFIEL